MKERIPHTAITGYIGSPDRQLYYCFEAPQSASPSPFGFVLCPPSGREYVFTHRVFRQLATRLSRAGFPVLRFDYFATGDSAGGDTEGSIAHWLDDISAAVNTFRNHTPGVRVWLIGFRVGASLATLYATQHQDIDGLILWDPVVNGNDYVDGRLAAHQRWLHRQAWRDKTAPAADGSREIIGFQLSPRLESDLRTIDLAALPRAPAPRALLMSSSPQPDPNGFGDRLAAFGVAVERQYMAWPEFWTEGAELDDILMPPARPLQAMVGWVQGVAR